MGLLEVGIRKVIRAIQDAKPTRASATAQSPATSSHAASLGRGEVKVAAGPNFAALALAKEAELEVANAHNKIMAKNKARFLKKGRKLARSRAARSTTAANSSTARPPLALEGTERWMRGAKIVFRLFPVGLRTLFRAEFENVYGSEWANTAESGQLLIQGGPLEVLVSDAVVVPPNSGLTKFQYQGQLASALHKGDKVRLKDEMGGYFDTTLAKDPSEPRGMALGSIVVAQKSPEFQGSKLQLWTQRILGCARCDKKAIDRHIKRKFLEGDVEHWDMTALRMILTDTYHSDSTGNRRRLMQADNGAMSDMDLLDPAKWDELAQLPPGTVVQQATQRCRNELFAHPATDSLSEDEYKVVQQYARLFARTALADNADFLSELDEIVNPMMPSSDLTLKADVQASILAALEAQQQEAEEENCRRQQEAEEDKRRRQEAARFRIAALEAEQQALMVENDL